MKLQLAQFLCFIPTFQEIYRVTGTAPDIGVQQKSTYRSSGRSFSGSSFLALLALLPKATGIFEDNDTIFRFLSFLYTQSTTNDANHTKEEDANNSNLSFRYYNRVNFSVYITKQSILQQQ